MNSTHTTPQTTPFSDTPCKPEVSAAPAELLTQVQLARRLGISRRTLATWVRHKTVPMIKVRGFCRFDYTKVCAALEQHEQAAAGTPEPTHDTAR